MPSLISSWQLRTNSWNPSLRLVPVPRAVVLMASCLSECSASGIRGGTLTQFVADFSRQNGSPPFLLKVVMHAARVQEMLLNRRHASRMHHRDGGEPQFAESVAGEVSHLPRPNSCRAIQTDGHRLGHELPLLPNRSSFERSRPMGVVNQEISERGSNAIIGFGRYFKSPILSCLPKVA